MKIKFDNVSKKFGSVVALDSTSFKVDKGEFVFITGRSGAGKSTVLSLLIRELLPTEGEIWIDELSIKGLKPQEFLKLRRRMGVIYQDFRLLSRMTVGENILLALDVQRIKKDLWQERLASTLKVVGLEERVNAFPAQLSGGELQKVALARVLVCHPKLILADEPTGNLDPESSWELVNLLKEINEKGTTVIMATHNFDIVNSMSKRVIKLERGKLVSDKKKGKYE